LIIPSGYTVIFYKQNSYKGVYQVIVGPVTIRNGGITLNKYGNRVGSMKITKTNIEFTGFWKLAASGSGSFSQTISRGTTTSSGNSVTKTDSTSMTNSVSAGFSFSYVIGADFRSEVSNTVSHSVSTTVSSEFSTTFSLTCQ
jgi:hypothetical protein